MNVDITTDTLLDALRNARATKPDDDPGLTTNEIADMFGWSANTVRKHLRKLQGADKLAHGRRTFTRLDGIETTVPVYRLRE